MRQGLRSGIRRAKAVVLAGVALGALAPGLASAALLGHGGPVRAVAVSPDGRIAITGGLDHALIVWRLADERPLRELVGHDAPVNAVALTPDGSTAVSASDDGTVAVWDLATGTLARRLVAGAKLATVAVSPDGGHVAAGGWDARVHRWRLAGGAVAQEEPALDAGGERVTAALFAGDGEALVVGGHEGSLRRWRTRDGVLLEQVAAHDLGLTGLAALPKSGWVTASIDRGLRTWSPDGGARGEPLLGHEQPVVALAASRDGGLLASAGARGEVLLWDLPGRRARLVLAGAGPTVWALTFTPDGDRLLGGGADGAVRVWDTATGALLGRPVPPPAAAPLGRGADLFGACAACHALAAEGGGNRAGPSLFGLFGRRAGTVPGYPYSAALSGSEVVWSEETVSRLLEVGPDRFLPGTKMPLQRLPDPRDRRALIDYLRRAGGG